MGVYQQRSQLTTLVYLVSLVSLTNTQLLDIEEGSHLVASKDSPTNHPVMYRDGDTTVSDVTPPDDKPATEKVETTAAEGSTSEQGTTASDVTPPDDKQATEKVETTAAEEQETTASDVTPPVTEKVETTTAEGNRSEQETTATQTSATETVGTVTDQTTETEGEKDREFLIPNPVSNVADSFTMGNKEYIMVQLNLKHSQAIVACKNEYKGILATVENKEVADFLAEALSETNLDLNSLWIGAHKSKKDGWAWMTTRHKTLIDPTFFNSLICKNPHVEDDEGAVKQCLAFSKSNHLNPQFRAINCGALRSFICQKDLQELDHSDNSTHQGWIRVDKRSYKIFFNQISWKQAYNQCPLHNINASLAVVVSNKEAQLLGRYLLIGRPSIENAWIGASYDEDSRSYRYESIDYSLANETGNQQFPPWRESRIEKAAGCILLDRHISNSTVFVEARCDRRRSYICSIETGLRNDEPEVGDIIVGNLGYRLVYDKKSWQDAFDFCHNQYGKYGGHLVTIDDFTENYYLLYAMGANRSDIQHIWISGRYEEGEWKWKPSNKTILLNKISLVENYTYTEEVERGYLCLNMDRENHMNCFHYGTDCQWLQSFVCAFTAEELAKLQREERLTDLETELTRF